MNNLNEGLHNNKNKYKFEIEERGRKVASLLTQHMTENEIAQELSVDQSTISRDEVLRIAINLSVCK